MTLTDRIRHIISVPLCCLTSDIADADRLADLGVESMDVLEIVWAIEDQFGVDVLETERKLFADMTVADLAALVSAKMENAPCK